MDQAPGQMDGTLPESRVMVSEAEARALRERVHLICNKLGGLHQFCQLLEERYEADPWLKPLATQALADANLALTEVEQLRAWFRDHLPGFRWSAPPP